MIGLSKTEVQKQMAANFPKFTANSFGISTNVNTLKYVNSKTDGTIIFYFGKDNKCQYSKMIEDIDFIQTRIKEFNTKYKPNGELKWIENVRGKNFNIKIEKDKYVFSVLITE
jgi:outer membrane protein assembly factor BamB